MVNYQINTNTSTTRNPSSIGPVTGTVAAVIHRGVAHDILRMREIMDTPIPSP
jgi:hypothetical protein